ncbi:hypothetical protein PCNPT3_07970 [Psychromonas sp. CNPT3]|uniref:tetratricopeptide repeat protein n=1 Tax=Psychromonas sp. CNPT3 TaxID=314282 RepID=UPI00006E56AC|nr:tetratricopeptide repeat protein [Psychromonas sp. CNPT3]AGH81532.1 hypothetical protein PCNPT3_07970 [Psychromonas sp. CNPT3]
MITSKDVFAERKSGNLDEAYQMGVQLVENNEYDEWNFKALAWCLVDLIKRDSSSNSQGYLESYIKQLESINVAPSDEILTKQVKFALSLCNPQGQLINQAKSLSKEGNHLQAANIYKQLCLDGLGDSDVQTSLGWELYRLLKQALIQEHINVYSAKRLLADYLKLQLIEKPSRLHSSILQLASRLAGNSSFNLLAFVSYWQLEYLSADDFQPYVNDKGDKYPSLGEKIIQQAAKESVTSNDTERINYILPHLDKAIELFPENIWLKLNKAKVLLKLGLSDEALQFAVEVTRSKVNDYWSWALLGDVNLQIDEAIAQSCYCKALLCYTDDKFTTKIRTKLAQLLVAQGEFSAAKVEVENVLQAKQKEGLKIPDDVSILHSSEWFSSFPTNGNNKSFYQSNIVKAEALLFSQLPFYKACIGDRFTIPDKPNKPKRKIYVKVNRQSEPIEISIPENKHRFSDIGTGLCIKGSFDEGEKYQVYLIQDRDTQVKWDIFSEHVGVVDHVNHKKNLFHFIVNKSINSIISFSDIDFNVEEGDSLLLKVAQFKTKQRLGYRVLSVKQTESLASTAVYREFNRSVRESNGMGFTDDNIFVAPPMISQYSISNGALVKGIAVLNYNKKKATWGWKALKILEVAQDVTS